MSSQDEMYDEINTLVGSLASAYGIEGKDAAKAVETGAMTLKLGVDGEGDRFVQAEFQGKVMVVYPGSAKPHMEAMARKPS